MMPVFFSYPCFVFALAHKNLKNFVIKTDFQFYAALSRMSLSGGEIRLVFGARNEPYQLMGTT